MKPKHFAAVLVFAVIFAAPVRSDADDLDATASNGAVSNSPANNGAPIIAITDAEIASKRLDRLNQEITFSRVALYTSVGLDLASTWGAMETGRFREVNPFMGQGKAQQAFVGFGSAFAYDWATTRLARNGHPKLASILRWAFSGVHFAAATHNLSAVARDKRAR